MSSKSNPFDDIERLFERLSDQFETLEPTELGLPDGRIAVDIHDEGENLVVVADLAGYDSDDIDVTLSDSRTLKLHAERETTTEESDERTTVRSERHTSVKRSVRLPEEVDEDATSAKYENGVLTVTLPKREPDDDSHSIPVE